MYIGTCTWTCTLGHVHHQDPTDVRRIFRRKEKAHPKNVHRTSKSDIRMSTGYLKISFSYTKRPVDVLNSIPLGPCKVQDVHWMFRCEHL